MSFTHILVPTDFSPMANHALRYALDEARLHQAHLTLLHVLTQRTGTEVYYLSGTPSMQVRLDPLSGNSLPAVFPAHPSVLLHDHDAEALQQLRELMPADFTGAWDVDVAVGEPATAIIRAAQDHRADLIVMATHGRTGLQHMFLGSVAEHVIRHAPCPVLVIRDMVHAALGEPT